MFIVTNRMLRNKVNHRIASNSKRKEEYYDQNIECYDKNVEIIM
jgi:hypothetical protein